MPPAPEKTLAFVRMGPFPIPNRLLPIHLEKALPGWRVEVLDIKPALRSRRWTLFLNLFVMLWENGSHLITGRLTPWQAFFTTTFLFERMGEIARRWVEAGDFSASIQIQSLFDAGTRDRPHLVYTDHTHLENLRYPDFDRRLLRRPAWLALERSLYQDATRVLTRSRNISDSAIQDYGCEPSQVEIIGSGSNIDFSSAPPRARPLGSPDELRILFVGTDFVRKGGTDLLEAFARLRERHPKATLQVAGPKEIPSMPGVEALGHQSADALRTLYREADVFCLPTRLEPFGVATLEAMHAGLPVVASRVGAQPELVVEEETGLLVPARDPDALFQALDRLARDPGLRVRMGERGRERATDRFSWDRVAERIAHILESETGPPEAPGSPAV